jgi:hypothetical protein
MNTTYLTSWKACAAVASLPFALAAGVAVSPTTGLILFTMVILSTLLVSPFNRILRFFKELHLTVAEKTKTPLWLSETLLSLGLSLLSLSVSVLGIAIAGFDFSNVTTHHAIIAALVIASGIASAVCLDIHLPKFSKSVRDLNATKTLFTRRLEIVISSAMFVMILTAVLAGVNAVV